MINKILENFIRSNETKMFYRYSFDILIIEKDENIIKISLVAFNIIYTMIFNYDKKPIQYDVTISGTLLKLVDPNSKDINAFNNMVNNFIIKYELADDEFELKIIDSIKNLLKYKNIDTKPYENSLKIFEPIWK